MRSATSADRGIRLTTARSRSGLKEIAASRFLLAQLVRRNLTVKYQRSALGFLWTFLNPLLTVAVLVLVFSLVVRIPIESYWAFLLSGYFAWNFASQSLLNATYVIQEHARLRRSVAFPAAVTILAACGSKLVELLGELVLVTLVLCLLHHRGVPAALTSVPLLVLLLALVTLGLMFPIAVLSTRFRDVQHAMPIAMTTLFYATPVFYPLDLVPEALQSLVLLNPYASLLTLFQQVLFEGRLPAPELLGIAAVHAVAWMALGHLLFQRYESLCVEIA